MLASVFGVSARFCNERCRHDFISDRLCGLNYGRHTFNNVVCAHHGMSRDWPDLFADLLKEQSYEIYGEGGYNRYYVDGHGTVYFSGLHAVGKNQISAAELGFIVR